MLNSAAMRVLHLGRFYNERFGGLERHVDLLLRGLAPYCAVDNLVAHDHFASATIPVEAYTVYKAPSLGTFAGTALCPTMPLLARALDRRHPYDIVHLHFPDPMAHLVAYSLPSRIRRVITWHSDIVRQKRLLALYRPFLRDIVRRADAIITATPAHAPSSTQLRAARPERLHVVPYGMPYARFDATAQDEEAIAALRAGLAPKRHAIFAVGRHVYYKGFAYLIRAMAGIPDAVLWLGGDGPLTSALKSLTASLQLNDRVRFLGRVADQDLPHYYHACDVFCMPSAEPAEAFGLVQLEAMACGKPVVCCELHNGVTYVNQDGKTGIVVAPRDVGALAGALRRLLGDKELRARLGANGLERAHAVFSVEAMVQGTLAVYQAVLAAR
ncbi:MAG: glycosyltransferase [Gammaproteobacteria bacterium]|nr:glycosyltransferase [Gammaproteobacteria bacterium]